MAIELHFDHGTLVAPGPLPDDERLAQLLVLDNRTGNYHTGNYRAPAHRYREILGRLHACKAPYQDLAKNYDRLELPLVAPLAPFPHQEAALAAWVAAGCTGIVELPTGAGKTLLAVLAIQHTGRPALIVVPTIDLMLQWQQVLQKWFGREIGMLGGGQSERRELTITTYDSAAAQTEFHGNRFGLLICDECHHLPAPAYRFIAAGSLAPYRLGLTATLERADGLEAVAMELLGPVRYRARIDELEGSYLAPYEIHTIEVTLDEEEQARYDECRALYVDALRGSGVSLNHPSGWAQFIAHCHRSEDGRIAFQAYREQKRIAFTARSKLESLWKILSKHRRDRILIFTEDNDTVYRLSRLLLLPVITHQTRPNERADLLGRFASGELPVLLTSKVLNEGVDVPDANVGVILSGNGSIREHVQRLGRILRKREGKRASLYEICTAVAAEGRISERRRQHSAYQRGEPPVHHHLPSPEELARQLAEQAEQDAAFEPSFTDEVIHGEDPPVLTRELLIFRRVKGHLRPTFIDARDELHQALASALIEIFEHGLGETRGTLDEALGVLVGEAKKQKFARGLVKLLQDRCTFEEAGDAASTLRRQAFVASAATLRALPDDASLDLYLERLTPALPLPLEDCRTQLYADLAEHRRLLTRVLPTPQALLERYNLAQAQGLALYAQRLRVRTPTTSQLELRKLLRWLKWSRLVAEVHREDDEWVLTVEGPGAMFDMQKKYGLQLATFLAAVPLLSKYTLEAEVDVPRGAKGTMVLDHKDPLRALDQSALGHIPPEIEAGMAALADERWTCEALPELRHTGATGMCVPDFGLRDRDSGAVVVVELFHRWHRHALLRRLNELQSRPDPELVLGVDLTLIKPGSDDELAARVQGHPQVFTFNKFPARKRLQPILDRMAAEALARPAKQTTTKPVLESATGKQAIAEPIHVPLKPGKKPGKQAIAKPTPTSTEPSVKPIAKRGKKPILEPIATPAEPIATAKPATRRSKPVAVTAEPEPLAPAATAGTARRRRAT